MNNSSPRERHHRGPNRTSRALIAVGSLLVILVVGGRWINEYLTLSRDAAQMDALQVEFADANQCRTQLRRIETTLSRELAQAQGRSVSPPDINEIREALIAMVREAGTSLRRLEIGDNEARVWAREGDSPRDDSAPIYGASSGFLLDKHIVQLQADGNMASVKKLLKSLTSHRWLMTTKGLQLSPMESKKSSVALDITLILYGLEPAPEESDEFEDDFDEEFEEEADFAMQSPPRVKRSEGRSHPSPLSTAQSQYRLQR